MYPYHRYMDPYPQNFPPQTHQNPYPYPYHYYPSWEAVPPHAKVDSSKPPLPFGPWPYNATFGHPNPTDYNGYCNSSYPPGYCGSRPLYSHIQAPPFPNAYPACFVPPPHYSVDQALFDHDKAKDHCCGCPNHTCHRKDGSSLKIEEQKPESDSTSLIRLPNHPGVWVPPSSTNEKEIRRNFESQPGFWKGWDPLDINGMRQGEEKNRHGEDKKMEFPWPIIWMPGYDKLKDENEVKKEIIPLKILEDENRMEKPGVVEDDKESKIKIIPVKQMDEKKSGVPEKQGSGLKNSDSKPASPRKPSKLAPVCLRVDPLPKKKTTSGTSRSPSPPKAERAHQGDKEQRPTLNETKAFDVLEEHRIEKKGRVEASGSEERKERRRELSQSDAAVLIQSAYRGFEVRRWQPLKKLQKIARIREQVADVRRQIGSIEAFSKHQDMKQRVIVSETIMNLLLQLDTIQGLHSSVREIRKSVARELVCLQEKLDSIGSQAVEGLESSEVEDNPTEITIVNELTEPAPGKESVQPANENGATVQPSCEEKGEGNSDQKIREVPAKETLEITRMFSGYEVSKEVPPVREDSHGSEVGATVDPELVTGEPHTTEEASKLSGSAGEEILVVPDGDITPNLYMQEDPKPQEVDRQELKAVERAAVHSQDSTLEPAIVECIDESDSTASKQGEDVTAHIEGSAPVTESGNEENKLVEENEKLRGMLEKLLEAGKQQLGVIADLNGRVKDLERKLVQKKRVKVKRSKLHRACH